MDLLYKQDKTASDVDELLHQHKKLVYHILKCTGMLNNSDAESLAWEALWDAINLFDIYSTTKFSTYACTIIHNRVVNGIKAAKHHETVELDDNMVILENEFENSELNKLIYATFDKYISNVSGVSRDVLLAWYGSGFTYSLAVVAELTKTSPSYAGRVLCSFRAYLATTLQKEGYLC